MLSSGFKRSTGGGAGFHTRGRVCSPELRIGNQWSFDGAEFLLEISEEGEAIDLEVDKVIHPRGFVGFDLVGRISGEDHFHARHFGFQCGDKGWDNFRVGIVRRAEDDDRGL